MFETNQGNDILSMMGFGQMNQMNQSMASNNNRMDRMHSINLGQGYVESTSVVIRGNQRITRTTRRNPETDEMITTEKIELI